MGCALLATASGLQSLYQLSASRQSGEKWADRTAPSDLGCSFTDFVSDMSMTRKTGAAPVDICTATARRNPSDRREIPAASRIGRNLQLDRRG